MKRNQSKIIVTYVFLVAMSIVFVFPFYFLVISATNSSIDVTSGKMLPGGELLQNLQHIFQQTAMLKALQNSAVVALCQTILALLIGSAAGYGFEIYRSRGKDMIFTIILLSMMVPFAAIMIPLFRLFGKLSTIHTAIGVNSYASVFLPYIATAFLIFYFRQNTKLFPRELLEAGRIDGVSEFGLFFKIYMPTMKTTYAAAAIITFMNSWNNYIWPLVVVQSTERQTVPLLISQLGSSYSPDYGMIMAAVLVATVPTLLIFFVLQKQFVAGMLGANK